MTRTLEQELLLSFDDMFDNVSELQLHSIKRGYLDFLKTRANERFIYARMINPQEKRLLQWLDRRSPVLNQSVTPHK